MITRTGFTLIELMIVVAIIAIIAAISIPNLLRSRMSANEAGAAGGMRTVSTAEFSYRASGIDPTSSGDGFYGSLAALGTGSAPFVDEVLSAGVKSGYSFEAIAINDNPSDPRFTSVALPIQPGRSGLRTYYVDESGVLRFDGAGGSPSSTSPPLN